MTERMTKQQESGKSVTSSATGISRFLPAWLKSGTLGRNTIWMFMGHGMGILIKAGYFIIIARILGPGQYGAFAGVVALVAILAPFATFGSGSLLVKNVSRDRSLFRQYWGNCLLLTFTSGSLLALLALGLSSIILSHRVPLMLVLLVSLADLLFARMVDVSVQAFQALEMVAHMARLNVVAGTFRLLGAVIVGVAVSHPTAVVWGIVYVGSSSIGAIWGLTWVSRLLGMPSLAIWRIAPEFAEGCYFSVSQSAQSIYNDIDKTMLTRLGSLDAVGIYAAAYRLIDAGFIPIRSLLYAAYPRFFQHGATGISGSTRYARRLLPRSGGYGLLACTALMVFAPVVPKFLGKEYLTTVEAVRWLAPIIFFRSIHYFLADSLTGAGHQGKRTAMQAGVALLNVALNLWLIPLYSWRGAAWASLASDGSLMVGLFIIIAVLFRKETKRQVLETAGNVTVEA